MLIIEIGWTDGKVQDKPGEVLVINFVKGRTSHSVYPTAEARAESLFKFRGIPSASG